MTEKRHPKRPTERETEESLRGVGSHLEYPPTPDVSRAVRRELESETEARSRRRRGRMRLPASVWVVAAMLLVFLAVPAVLAAAMGGWLPVGQGYAGGAGQSGGGAADGEASGGSEPAPDLPDSAAGSAGRNSSGSAGNGLGDGLGLEKRVSLQKAGELVGFEVLTPGSAELSEPDEVYRTDGEGVILLYGARPGLPEMGDTGLGMVVIERAGDVGSAYPGALATDSDYETVRVGNETGYWFPDGREPGLRNGGIQPPPGGVLLWERAGTTVEVRSVLSRDAAVEVADTFR